MKNKLMEKYDKLTEAAAEEKYVIISGDKQWGIADKGNNNFYISMLTKGIKKLFIGAKDKAQRILNYLKSKPDFGKFNFDLVEYSTLGLEEMSTSGDAGAYMTPNAFSGKGSFMGKGQNTNGGIENSKSLGFTVVGKEKKNTVKSKGINEAYAKGKSATIHKDGDYLISKALTDPFEEDGVKKMHVQIVKTGEKVCVKWNKDRARWDYCGALKENVMRNMLLGY